MDINLHKFICSDMGLLSACFAEQLSAVGNAFFVNTSAAVHCNTGSQQCCVSAVTPMEIGSLYRCAVTQHQSTAALFLKVS
jgi:predicted transcriptional regulator